MLFEEPPSMNIDGCDLYEDGTAFVAARRHNISWYTIGAKGDLVLEREIYTTEPYRGSGALVGEGRFAYHTGEHVVVASRASGAVAAIAGEAAIVESISESSWKWVGVGNDWKNWGYFTNGSEVACIDFGGDIISGCGVRVVHMNGDAVVVHNAATGVIDTVVDACEYNIDIEVWWIGDEPHIRYDYSLWTHDVVYKLDHLIVSVWNTWKGVVVTDAMGEGWSCKSDGSLLSVGGSFENYLWIKRICDAWVCLDVSGRASIA